MCKKQKIEKGDLVKIKPGTTKDAWGDRVRSYMWDKDYTVDSVYSYGDIAIITPRGNGYIFKPEQLIRVGTSGCCKSIEDIKPFETTTDTIDLSDTKIFEKIAMDYIKDSFSLEDLKKIVAEKEAELVLTEQKSLIEDIFATEISNTLDVIFKRIQLEFGTLSDAVRTDVFTKLKSKYLK